MIAGIVATVAALIGWLFFERNKRQSAEALLVNQETKEKVTELTGKQNENAASLQLEEERRENINAKANEEKSNPVNGDELLDFFKKLQ